MKRSLVVLWPLRHGFDHNLGPRGRTIKTLRPVLGNEETRRQKSRHVTPTIIDVIETP